MLTTGGLNGTAVTPQSLIQSNGSVVDVEGESIVKSGLLLYHNVVLDHRVLITMHNCDSLSVYLH